MANISLPNSPSNQDGDDIEFSDVYDNDLAIAQVVNGQLDNNNIAPNAGIAIDKLDSAFLDAVGANSSSVTRRATAQVATSQATTTSTGWQDLGTPGPSVTIAVPADSLVAVFAQVTMNPSDFGGQALVGLYEATDISTPLQIMSSTGTAVQTRYSAPGTLSGVQTVTAGGWLVFPATSGTRTYTLKYATSLGGQSHTFSNRKLTAIALGGWS